MNKRIAIGPALAADDITLLAAEAASFLKALSHKGRLMMQCHLSAGEKSVNPLEDLLGARQAAVSSPSPTCAARGRSRRGAMAR